MTDIYTLKVNRRDGSIEVSGTDKEWVESKLSQLGDVLKTPLVEARDEGHANSRRKRPSRSRQRALGDSSASSVRRASRRKPSGSTRVRGLDLAPAGKQSFKEFVSERKPKSQHDKNALSIYYLTEVAGVTPVTSNHVYTCYRDQNWDMPPSMAASLCLTASKKGFIDTGNLEGIKIEPRGVNHAERGLPAKKET
jgi:hypothetical protein